MDHNHDQLIAWCVLLLLCFVRVCVRVCAFVVVVLFCAPIIFYCYFYFFSRFIIVETKMCALCGELNEIIFIVHSSIHPC
jgi:hypothetical protein